MAEAKVVLMTGGSAGIGLATATRLARDPDQRFLVIATVISFKEQDDLVAAVGDRLNKTLFIKELNVTKDDQINSIVDDVIEEHGRIDILLNIAGIAITGYIDTMPRSQIDLTFNINTIGVIRLTQAVLPHMKKQKAGKIITITSMAGKLGAPMFEIYCASKFATDGFMESIAPVARLHNIRVSVLEPLLINTGLKTDILRGIQELVDNESANELDRQYARNWQSHSRGTSMYASPLETSDAVAKMMEIIEANEPVLRYQLPGGLFKTPMMDIVCDQTGESSVERNLKRLREEKAN